MSNRKQTPERLPIIWVALGRQRVGKTALLNSAVQFFRKSQATTFGCGMPISKIRATRSRNSSPMLEHVPEGGIEDAKVWIEGRLEDLIEHRYDAVLNAGGGATGFTKLVQEVPLLEAIEGSSVRLVGLFDGPERADLDYLEQYAEAELFMPAASMLVLNAGLVLSGRSATGAFGPILQHPAVKRAAKAGARTAMLPHLACMSQVTDGG